MALLVRIYETHSTSVTSVIRKRPSHTWGEYCVDGNEWMFELPRSIMEHSQLICTDSRYNMRQFQPDHTSPTTSLNPWSTILKMLAFILFYFICIAPEFPLIWHFLIYFSFLHKKKGSKWRGERVKTADSHYDVSAHLQQGPIYFELSYYLLHATILFSLGWNFKAILLHSLV